MPVSSDPLIAAAAAELRAGNLVAIPTETVYGLGANAWDEEAVAKIFEAKGRPATNPLIVHLFEAPCLGQCVDLPLPFEISASLERLIPFWPGPLTVVLPKSSKISNLVTAGRDTVAVRVPQHPVARELLQACEFPIAAPSANRSTAVSPTTAQHVADELGDQVAMILDGGPSTVGLESTIINLTESPPRILRHGGMTAEALAEALNVDVQTLTRGANQETSSTTASYISPGQMTVHYSPRTPVQLVSDWTAQDHERIGWIQFSSTTPTDRAQKSAQVTRTLSERGDMVEIARRLFATLRELDQLGLDRIVIDTCEEHGLGRAIMDRIRRASARRIS